MPRPYEMVAGPLTVYTAPESTKAPALNLAPGAPWELLGTNGGRTISEDGLTLEFSETVEGQRVDGSTAIQKLFRTEEDLMLSCALLDVTVETFAKAMSGLPVETVAPGPAVATDFTVQPVPIVTGGTGTGAVIASIVVNVGGDITAVTWSSGGSGYVATDILTFTQGDVTGSYTVQTSDLSAGVLDDLASVTIAGMAPSTPEYRHTRLLRGFSVLNLAFLAKGFSPYGDTIYAQYWVPKAYASFSGSLTYTKGAAAMIELEIMAIEELLGRRDRYAAYSGRRSRHSVGLPGLRPVPGRAPLVSLTFSIKAKM